MATIATAEHVVAVGINYLGAIAMTLEELTALVKTLDLDTLRKIAEDVDESFLWETIEYLETFE